MYQEYQEPSSNSWFQEPSIYIPYEPDSVQLFEGESTLFTPLIPVLGTHLSEPHKQEEASYSLNQPSNIQNEAILTSTGLAGHLDQTPPFEDSDDEDDGSNQPQRKKAIKKVSRRKDDNNNAHKKFITVQNAVLTRLNILKGIKKGLKNSGIKFDKGSRHSFINRMTDTKKYCIDKPEKLERFKAEFIVDIAETFKPSNNPAEALLHSLVEYYSKSCELFYEGKISESIEMLYNLPSAKEEKYKDEGIQKAIDYYRKRFPS